MADKVGPKNPTNRTKTGQKLIRDHVLSEEAKTEEELQETWDSDEAIHRLFHDIYNKGDEKKKRVRNLIQQGP